MAGQETPLSGVVTELRRSPVQTEQVVKDLRNVLGDLQKLLQHFYRLRSVPTRDRTAIETMLSRIETSKQQLQQLIAQVPPEPVKPEQKGVMDTSSVA